jgi:hypothetical protein
MPPGGGAGWQPWPARRGILAGMTRHQRLARRFTSSARPRRRNRAARHAGPVTIEWDERGTFQLELRAGGEPGTVTASPGLITGPAFLAWARPDPGPRPWVQSFPHRRGASSRPGSGRRRRNRAR